MAFGEQKQSNPHQRYEAKSRNQNLTILVDSESEVFSSTAIAALPLSAVGLDLQSKSTRILDTN